jgi:hypothetical protein
MSYKFLAKNGPTLAFALVVVCVVIAIIPIFSGLSEFSNVPTERQSYAPEGGIFLAGIYISVALLVIAIIIALLLSLLQVATNPKASIKALISFGVVAVLFFILYAMADPKGTGSLANTIQNFNISEGISKLIGGGIQLSVIMLIGSFVIAILMEIWNYFKNQ